MVVDAWKNFEMSGKVSDYLAYRQDVRQGGRPPEEAGALLQERGRNRYGAERGSDGNGVKRHADWRL